MTGPIAYSGPAPRITYHRGPLQHHPRVFLVFWGRSWQPSDLLVAAEERLFCQLPGTAYLASLRAYGVHAESFGGAYFLHRTDRGRIRYRDLAHVAAEATAHFRVRRLGDAQFVILPDAAFNLSFFASDGGECGEHDYLTWHGQRYVVALVMPFASRYAPDCNYDYSTNDGSRFPADLIAGTTALTAHEFVETATDPRADGSGWADTSDPRWPVELADVCYFDSGTPSGLGENVTYVWNPARRECELPSG